MELTYLRHRPRRKSGWLESGRWRLGSGRLGWGEEWVHRRGISGRDLALCQEKNSLEVTVLVNFEGYFLIWRVLGLCAVHPGFTPVICGDVVKSTQSESESTDFKSKSITVHVRHILIKVACIDIQVQSDDGYWKGRWINSSTSSPPRGGTTLRHPLLPVGGFQANVIQVHIKWDC